MNPLAWNNLVFLIPIALAVVLMFGSATGLSEFGADVDVDADVNVDADADMDADADADADTEHDADGGYSVLTLLGVGKVPLSLLLMTALFLFGGIGLCTSTILSPVLGGNLAGVVALTGAVVGAAVLTGVVARIVARVLPSTETYAGDELDLVGCTGVALLDIGESFGVAHVADDGGALMKIRCRTYEGRIEKGAAVLVTELDPESHVFTVEKSPV
ncbi:MAG: DUF1449 family protein [Polyangiaceae bacterium]